MTVNDIFYLIITLAIFFVGFIVVGSQWVKHHMLFAFCEEVSSKVIWRNLIYLFFLSLIPFFTKWIMEKPGEIIPTIGYDVIFLLVMFSFQFMRAAVLKDGNHLNNLRIYNMSQKALLIIASVYIFLVLIIFGISFYYPTVSLIFFILIPVVHSLSNLWLERNFEEKIPKLKPNNLQERLENQDEQ